MKLRILCLEPGWHHSSADGPMWSWPVRELGAEIVYYGGRLEALPDLADGTDVAVYFSTMDGAQHPSTEALLAVRKRCRRFVLTCTDGSHTDHALLREYADRNVFDAMVNLDGGRWEWRPQDWSAFGLFDPTPWERRNIPRTHRLGFNGRLDGRRELVLGVLRRTTDLKLRVVNLPPQSLRYQDYIDWTLGCMAIINPAGNGDPSDRSDQVKGRVNEAALAGCLLFEEADSPVRHYLRPSPVEAALEGIPDGDYLEFGWSVAPVSRVVNRSDFPELARVMGERLRRKVLDEWGPKRFWDKVIDG